MRGERKWKKWFWFYCLYGSQRRLVLGHNLISDAFSFLHLKKIDLVLYPQKLGSEEEKEERKVQLSITY